MSGLEINCQCVSSSWQDLRGEHGVLWAYECHPSKAAEYVAGCPGWGNHHPAILFSICYAFEVCLCQTLCRHWGNHSSRRDICRQKDRLELEHRKLSCDELGLSSSCGRRQQSGDACVNVFVSKLLQDKIKQRSRKRTTLRDMWTRQDVVWSTENLHLGLFYQRWWKTTHQSSHATS